MKEKTRASNLWLIYSAVFIELWRRSPSTARLLRLVMKKQTIKRRLNYIKYTIEHLNLNQSYTYNLCMHVIKIENVVQLAFKEEKFKE